MRIRVELPYHLRTLAAVTGHEVEVEVEDPVTVTRVLDALEEKYPTLRGTIREHVSRVRRPLLRYFAAGTDISYDSPDLELPATVKGGSEPLIVLGAIAGG